MIRCPLIQVQVPATPYGCGIFTANSLQIPCNCSISCRLQPQSLIGLQWRHMTHNVIDLFMLQQCRLCTLIVACRRIFLGPPAHHGHAVSLIGRYPAAKCKHLFVCYFKYLSTHQMTYIGTNPMCHSAAPLLLRKLLQQLKVFVISTPNCWFLMPIIKYHRLL